MEFIALWQVLRRRWWLVALPTVIVLLATLPALPTMVFPSTSYLVAMRFTAAAPSDVSLDALATYEDSVYVPWLASEYVVVNLPQWVTSDSFAREVNLILAEDGLNIAADDLRTAFVADSARSILVIYMTWDEAEELEAIAESAVTVLKSRNQVYFPQFAAHPADVQALDDIRINTVAPSLVTRFSPLLRIVVGVAAGLGLAIFAEYLDHTIRSREELTAFGLPILGVIPKE